MEYEYEDEFEYEEDYKDEDIPVFINQKPSPTNIRKQRLHGHFLSVHPPSISHLHHLQNVHKKSQFPKEVPGRVGQYYSSYGESPHLTLSGSLKNALIKDVDDRVRTEVKRFPGGRVSTKVTIGGRGSAPANTILRKAPRKFQKKDSNNKSKASHTSPHSFSDLMTGGI